MSGSKLDVRDVTLMKGGARIIRPSSFKVPCSSIVAIVGPSGSGKTSMLRLLNRLDEPASGEILLDGQSTVDMDPRELRRKVGMVFQLPTMFEGSVADNIAYGPRLRREEDIEGRVAVALSSVGLPDSFLERDAEKLSVGQAQRVTIARAIANDPEVLLMDEPTSALDPDATGEIELLIRDLNRDLDLTFIVVTHNRRQARRIGTHVMLMEDGMVVDMAPVKEFFSRHSMGPEEECCR